jgi:L-ascorbate metabolism protein UlaG (beta-lactamase superfamily)
MVARWNTKWLWIGILSVCLVACSQGPSTATTDVVGTDAISTSPSPDSTTKPIPVTAAPLPPSPTSTPTRELPTETPLPPSPTNTPTRELPTETPLPTESPTLTPIPWPTSEAFFDGARVTFVNNAGFLITVGDKKILIDALYDTNNPNIDPPKEVLQRAVNAEPPFDQIDLVIATHSHADHFSADLVRDHLRNNELAVFVSSPDAVRQIKGMGDEFDERLIPVYLEPGESSHLSVNGIELDCLYFTHGDASVPNFGVVITVDDYTFFHSGDMSIDSMAEDAVSLADLQGYGLHQKEIDLAILNIYMFSVDEGVTLIENGIQARYVSPMHYPYQYPPTSVEGHFSNAVVFKDTLENWVVPLE